MDYQVVMGNPPDGPMLVPAIKRIIERFGRIPRAVAADRGYGEASIDAGLEALGVTHVAIPRKGRPSAGHQKVQRSGRFTKLVKWRTGSEGRISSLKPGAGWGRTLTDGLDGTEIWCGWGILAQNSFKIAALIEARDTSPARPARTRPPRPAGSGPPTGPPAMSPTAA